MKTRKKSPRSGESGRARPTLARVSALPGMVCQITLCYQPTIKPSERRQTRHSRDCYECFREGWDLKQIHLREEFKIMLLNRMNRVLGIVTVSSGGIAGTFVDQKLIFAAALVAGASSIILAHNHPSGETKPSRSDVILTQKIKAAAEILDLAVVDHLIVGEDRYYSFTDEGLL